MEIFVNFASGKNNLKEFSQSAFHTRLARFSFFFFWRGGGGHPISCAVISSLLISFFWLIIFLTNMLQGLCGVWNTDVAIISNHIISVLSISLSCGLECWGSVSAGGPETTPTHNVPVTEETVFFFLLATGGGVYWLLLDVTGLKHILLHKLNQCSTIQILIVERVFSHLQQSIYGIFNVLKVMYFYNKTQVKAT